MSYPQTVIGYTSEKALSHSDILCLIAKKVLANGLLIDLTDKPAIDEFIESLEGNAIMEVEIEFHDDIVDIEDPDAVAAIVENYDEFRDQIGNIVLGYKKYPEIRVGTFEEFTGIIVDIKSYYSDMEYSIDLDSRLTIAKAWLDKLQETSRISGVWKFKTVTK